MRSLFVFIFFVFPKLLFGNSETISRKDLEHIRYFAKKFIEEDHASHVIFFDNKAVCSGGCVLQGRDKSFGDVHFLKGWNAFKRNEHLFSHPNYIFQEQVLEDNGLCGYYKILGICIINKRALINCLNVHLCLFKETLGDSFDVGQFVSELENGCAMDDLLHHDEMLLGILLGYGEESAKAFKCSYDSGDLMNRVQANQKDGKIYPVTFMGNENSSEVQNLVSKYDGELEAFSKYYKEKDPLVVFLEGIQK